MYLPGPQMPPKRTVEQINAQSHSPSSDTASAANPEITAQPTAVATALPGLVGYDTQSSDEEEDSDNPMPAKSLVAAYTDNEEIATSGNQHVFLDVYAELVSYNFIVSHHIILMISRDFRISL